jgi:hypothetical protein
VLASALCDALQNKDQSTEAKDAKEAQEARAAKAAIEAQEAQAASEAKAAAVAKEAEMARAAIAAQQAATRAQELATKKAKEAQEAKDAKVAQQAQEAKEKLQEAEVRSAATALVLQPWTDNVEDVARSYKLCRKVINKFKPFSHKSKVDELLLDQVYAREAGYSKQLDRAEQAKQEAAELQEAEVRGAAKALLLQPWTDKVKDMARSCKLCREVINKFKPFSSKSKVDERLLDQVYAREAECWKRLERAEKAKQEAAEHGRNVAEDAASSSTARSYSQVVQQPTQRSMWWTCSRCGDEDNHPNWKRCNTCHASEKDHYL